MTLESEPESPESNPPEPTGDSHKKRSPTALEKILQYPWAGLTVLFFGIAGVTGSGYEVLLRLFGFDFTILSWISGVAALLFVFGLPMTVLAYFITHPPAKKETQHRLLVWGGALFASAVLLTLPPLILPAVQSARQAAGNTLVEKTFANDRFSLQVPQSWQPVENAQPQAGVLQLSDPHDELQLVAYAVHQADVPAKTLSELQRLQVKEMSRSLNNVKSEIVMDRKWATPAEIETTLTGSTETANYWYLLRHIEYGDYWIEIRFGTTPSRLDHYAELMAQITDSVQPASVDGQ